MKSIWLAVCLSLTGCAVGSEMPPGWANWKADAGSEAGDGSSTFVCAPHSCGHVIVPGTGSTVDCGDCGFHSVCGDNSIPNVCGAACLPSLDSNNKPTTDSCDYILDPNGISGDWANGLGDAVQYPGACHYTNPHVCVGIYIAPTPGRTCKICGEWACCISNPAAGLYPLLPGAVRSDG